MMVKILFSLKVAADCSDLCGNAPPQIPPLELSELFAGWQNGGAKQSNKQYKAVTVICCDRFLRQCAASDSACGNVPLQIPPIKIIVLAECNPSGSRPNFFGRQHLTFDKGGKGVGDFRGIVRFFKVHRQCSCTVYSRKY